MKKHNLQSGEPEMTTGGQELQAFGTIVPMPIALKQDVCRKSVVKLNALLADTMTLRDLYKKHHWQVAGPQFYSLHLLFDKHYEAQAELVDAIAERIQLLGGVSVAMAADVAAMTRIPAPPSGREEPPVQLTRLLNAHEVILRNAHEAADETDESGDHGSTDLLSSKIIPANELQVWFVSQHLVPVQVAPGQKHAEQGHASAA